MDGSPGTTTDRLLSPILSIERGDSDTFAQLVEMHSHPEPKLLWTSTATVTVTTAAREWLVPPGFGLWIPGGIEHGGSVLRPGEGSAITFAPDRCPITWTAPTGVAIGPLLRELTTHLIQSGPQDPTRLSAEDHRREADRRSRRPPRARRLGRPGPLERPDPVPSLPQRDRPDLRPLAHAGPHPGRHPGTGQRGDGRHHRPRRGLPQDECVHRHLSAHHRTHARHLPPPGDRAPWPLGLVSRRSLERPPQPPRWS
jgi:hypothetical protein